MKRRWWIVIGVTACSVIALITTLSIFCKDPIAQNADKIKGGMSEEDVICLFGRTADEVEWINLTSRAGVPNPVIQPYKTWRGSGVSFSAMFTDAGKVDVASIRIEKTETLMDKIAGFLSPSQSEYVPLKVPMNTLPPPPCPLPKVESVSENPQPD
jgi:hypothetical protein